MEDRCFVEILATQRFRSLSCSLPARKLKLLDQEEILAVGLVMLLPLRFAPRLLIGADGVRALAAITEFLGEKFPRLLTSGLLQRILPIREMTGGGSR